MKKKKKRERDRERDRERPAVTLYIGRLCLLQWKDGINERKKQWKGGRKKRRKEK